MGSASVVLDDIARIKEIIKDDGIIPATGFGSLLKGLPTSDAYNVNSISQSILSTIGFGRLKKMREASVTGGALGNVSNIEIQLLQSELGKLDQGQTEEQYLRTLDRIEKSYIKVMTLAAQVPDIAKLMTAEEKQRFGQSLSNAQGGGGGGTTAPIRYRVISQ